MFNIIEKTGMKEGTPIDLSKLTEYDKNLRENLETPINNDITPKNQNNHINDDIKQSEDLHINEYIRDLEDLKIKFDLSKFINLQNININYKEFENDIKRSNLWVFKIILKDLAEPLSLNKEIIDTKIN